MLTHSGPGARLQMRPKLSTIVYLRAFVLLCTTQARNVDTFNLPVINHRKRVVVGGGRDRSGKRRMFSLFLHSEPFRVVRRCVCVRDHLHHTYKERVRTREGGLQIAQTPA
jgi:hypothetical protein